MRKVLCVGEALIDFVSNQPGKNLIETTEFTKKAGGAPANVAAALSKFGVEPYFAGTVGRDQFGAFLKHTMEDVGINTKYMQFMKAEHTTFAYVALAKDGERDFEFARGADAKFELSMIDDLEQFDCFHFGSATAFLGDKLGKTYFELLEYAVANEKIITFDANYRDALFDVHQEQFIKSSKTFIKHSTIVKLSEEELKLISGCNDVEQGIEELYQLGCKVMVVTLGKEGSLLRDVNGLQRIPTQVVEMIDATGAGDAFIGSLIALFLNTDKPLNEIIKIANQVGAMTTTKIGALSSIPTIEELSEIYYF